MLLVIASIVAFFRSQYSLVSGNSTVLKKTVSATNKTHISRDSDGQTLVVSTGIPQDQLPSLEKNTLIPPPTLNDDYLNRFIVVPERQLIFCYVDKVGCTMFNQITRLLRLLDPRLDVNERDWQTKSEWMRNTPQHHHISKQDLETFLVDPTWTKAVFYRDPAIRFLSAFRYNCLKGTRRGRRCKDVFGMKNLTFDEALNKVDANTSIVTNSIHMMPASFFCGGLQNTLQHYDFVRELTESTSPQAVGTLLEIIGVESNITKHIVDCFVRGDGCVALRPMVQGQFQFPPKKIDNLHNTGSSRNGIVRDSFKSSERLEIIRRAYQVDYNTFQIPEYKLEELGTMA